MLGDHFTRIRPHRIQVHIYDGKDEVLIVHWLDVFEDERSSIADPFAAWSLLGRWIHRNKGADNAELIDVLRRLDGAVPWGFGPPTEHDYERWVIPIIEDAASSGRLVALRFPLPQPVASQAVPPRVEPPKKRPPPPGDDPKYQFQVRLIDDIGAPIGGARVRFEIEGTPFLRTTGGDGTASIDWFSSGPAALELLAFEALVRQLKPRWAKAPPANPLPDGQAVATGEPPKGIPVASGAQLTLVICRAPLVVDVVEMEDIHFHFDSAVVLPWRFDENTTGRSDGQTMSALSVIAAALRYVKDNPDKQVLLAGHADSTGQADYNRKLSRARAEATQALLKGDKDAWKTVCAAHQKVEDLQQALAWVAEAHGWPCHPGAVDNQMGPKTRAARRAFRRRYNDEFSGSLSLDAETSAEDWGAFYDLYELALSDELGDDLSAARAALSFWAPAILACGEDFAQGTNRPGGMRSAADRRVDLLFLDPSEPYPDFFSEKPPGNSIYGPCPTVLRRYLPIGPPVQFSLLLTAIEGLYKPGYVADGDVAPKASGYQPGYLSEDDQGRIFANHKPRTDPSQGWDDVVIKDTQFIELCAAVDVLQGKVPSDARVEWEWFDPNDADHPANNNHGARVPDEIDVDGNPRSLLNRGVCDYPRPSGHDMARFAQAGDLGFADGPTIKVCNTEIRDGKSRVRLHVSNVAGDNFVVIARMKNSPRIAPCTPRQTGVMTVWKRIDVEYVRMADAFALPTDKVAPFFEPARVQMDFSPERTVPAKPFLTVQEDDEEKACARYASKQNGEFKSEGKPGWFFLAAAQRASSENARPGGGGGGGVRVAYAGLAKVAVVYGAGQNWEKVIVEGTIDGKVSILKVYDAGQHDDDDPHGYQGVWKKEVIAGKTHLHLDGIDYASDFEVPRGKDTGRIGAPGRGGALDKMDLYYLRHRLRLPSAAWTSGGMGFDEEVFIRAFRPGSVETGGLSPSARYAGQEYFAGRLLIFTRAFAATSLDEDGTVSTIVHEFTHAFGYPHKCGYYGWPRPPSYSCAMNYFLTWLYAIGTRNLQRFEFGQSGAHLCSKHLAGVREVHLEDNPAMWTWT